MNCEQYVELMLKELDNEINDEQRNMLFKHMQDCNDCKNDYRELCNIESVLNAQRSVEAKVPDSFSTAVMGKIKRPKRKIARCRPYFTVAAACIVLVAAIYGGTFDRFLGVEKLVQNNNKSASQGVSSENQAALDARLAPDIKDLEGSKQGDAKGGSLHSAYLDDGAVNRPQQRQASDDKPAQSKMQEYGVQDQIATQGQDAESYADSQNSKNEIGALNSQDGLREENALTAAPDLDASGSLDMQTVKQYAVIAEVLATEAEVEGILKDYEHVKVEDFKYEVSKTDFEEIYTQLQSGGIDVKRQDFETKADKALIVASS